MSDVLTERVEEALEACLRQTEQPFGQTLQDAMAHALLKGGKRLRARLVLLFCKLAGGSVEGALSLACAIEMVHAHSLVHDDLPCMDNADTRRGKPSCHAAFGESTALLAGDALLALAFSCVTESARLTDGQKAQAVRVIAKATHGMLVGQVMDKAFEDQPIDQPTLEELQNNKTGQLIAAACVLGGIAAGGDSSLLEAAEAYGRALGRAFQIVDDILDITATQEVMGKPVGNDAKCDKNTFVSLLGLEEATRQAGDYTQRAIDALAPYGAEAEELIELARTMQERTN